ncbi:MAG: class I SAM-dependent methyltransferase [Planctomycetota bacterium]
MPGSGVFTPGAQGIDFRKRFDVLGVDPSWFARKRVLDIGAFTGSLTFLLEDLGAEVVAFDIADPDLCGFNIVRECRGSDVRHVRQTVYNLHPQDHGMFDAVMYFGVFYHLKHPILALERINAVLREGGLLLGGGTTIDRWFHNHDESCQQGCDLERITMENVVTHKDTHGPIMSVDTLNELPLCGFASEHFIKQTNNWFVPNTECVLGWLNATGFDVSSVHRSASRLQRDWNTENLLRSIMLFNASKARPPTSEVTQSYLEDFEIPVAGDLVRKHEVNS